MIKVTGSLQKSTEIMKLSNALIKLPQISQVMREMSMEMTKVRRYLTLYLDLGLTFMTGRDHGRDARGYLGDGRGRRTGRGGGR